MSGGGNRATTNLKNEHRKRRQESGQSRPLSPNAVLRTTSSASQKEKGKEGKSSLTMITYNMIVKQTDTNRESAGERVGGEKSKERESENWGDSRKGGKEFKPREENAGHVVEYRRKVLKEKNKRNPRG